MTVGEAEAGWTLSRVRWQSQYRVIPSEFPPINFFEDLVDPALMDAAFEVEAMTNDRLREETGEIGLVRPEDRVSGPGSSVVMAAFTHIGRPTRFSDGRFGVYYAARTLETAVRETVFHRERFMRYTAEPPADLDMRAYVGRVRKSLVDIRGPDYAHLHDPDVSHYPVSQAFGAEVRAAGQWGIVYNSVRHPGGHCIAALRPPAVSIPRQGPQLLYRWDGERIRAVYEKNDRIFSLQ
jgi:hypothetical protein